MANVFVPEYLDVNYNTLVSYIKEELADNNTFRDFNYEGSNIAVLIELIAYIGELNTYFLNKIAKNVFMESVDIYENANRLARLEGYEPKGYISSKTRLNVTVDGENGTHFKVSNTLQIPAWKKISSSKQYDGAVINFYTTESTNAIAESDTTVDIAISVVQGDLVTLSFTGKDIVDNELTLPTYNYAHDDDLDDDINTVELKVNGITWSRISDFYDEIGVLADEDDVYMMVYDKYERTKILFSSTRNVPESNDEITIYALKSLGVNGNVAANTITSPETYFVQNISNSTVGPNEDGWLSNSTITVSNSAASIGGAQPEDVDEVRKNAAAVHNAQYRNVTAMDYKSNLETRSDVECAHAWGEKDIAPSGSILEYNKVHIAVVPPNDPDEWETGTINTSSSTWVPSGGTLSGTVYTPTSYNSAYTSELEVFLEPRKMLNAYEDWELPELVYFSFTFGVRLYRLFNISDVSTDIKNKLIYMFRPSNMDFYYLLDHKDIVEYILDTTITSTSDNFDYIKGIRNLILRDIDCNFEIHETNTNGNYPQYTVDSYHEDTENKLRPIRLGLNQFPVLCSDTVEVVEET